MSIGQFMPSNNMLDDKYLYVSLPYVRSTPGYDRLEGYNTDKKKPSLTGSRFYAGSGTSAASTLTLYDGWELSPDGWNGQGLWLDIKLDTRLIKSDGTLEYVFSDDASYVSMNRENDNHSVIFPMLENMGGLGNLYNSEYPLGTAEIDLDFLGMVALPFYHFLVEEGTWTEALYPQLISLIIIAVYIGEGGTPPEKYITSLYEYPSYEMPDGSGGTYNATPEDILSDIDYLAWQAQMSWEDAGGPYPPNEFITALVAEVQSIEYDHLTFVIGFPKELFIKE